MPTAANTRVITVILVLGSVHIKAGQLAEALALSQQHVVRSRAEPGCFEHGVHVAAEDGQRLVFVERWADLPALHAHFAVAASRQFVKDLAAMATAAPSIALSDAQPRPLRGSSAS